MPKVLPGTDKIGDWNLTQLTRFMTDWFKQHPLPVSNVVSAAVDEAVTSASSPGTELGYDQITATVNVTGLTSGAPTTVLTSSKYAFDGSLVMAEFYASEISTPSAAAGNNTNIGLYENGTLIAVLGQLNTSAAATHGATILARLRFKPSPGQHVYTIGAWASNTTGTPRVFAGTGVGGAVAPAYLRLTKV